MFNMIFEGSPNAFQPAIAGPGSAIDCVNGVAYYSGNNTAGWTPITAVLAKSDTKGLTANNANLLTFVAPYTAAYVVSFYEVSTNTPTGATLPSITLTYTDADSGVSVTLTSADATAVSSAGVVVQGSLLARAAAGTNIVLATTNYAAGSGTALAYSANTRILFSS